MVRGCRVRAFLFVHSRSEPMWLTGGGGRGSNAWTRRRGSTHNSHSHSTYNNHINEETPMKAQRKAFRKTLLAFSIFSCLLASVYVQAQEGPVEEVVIT